MNILDPQNNIVAKKLIGRFYFKVTKSKNLIGEFSNNTLTRNYAESAVPTTPSPDDAKSENPDEFAGNYFSTWFEEIDSESVLAVLKIWKKQHHQNIFSLTWSIQDGKNTGISFWGEGMVCEGMLIGDYRNFDPIP